MAGSGGGRGGGKRASGGSSVAAGRKAKARYQMQQAKGRFKKISGYMPSSYAPQNTRK